MRIFVSKKQSNYCSFISYIFETGFFVLACLSLCCVHPIVLSKPSCAFFANEERHLRGTSIQPIPRWLVRKNRSELQKEGYGSWLRRQLKIDVFLTDPGFYIMIGSVSIIVVSLTIYGIHTVFSIHEKDSSDPFVVSSLFQDFSEIDQSQEPYVLPADIFEHQLAENSSESSAVSCQSQGACEIRARKACDFFVLPKNLD